MAGTATIRSTRCSAAWSTTCNTWPIGHFGWTSRSSWLLYGASSLAEREGGLEIRRLGRSTVFDWRRAYSDPARAAHVYTVCETSDHRWNVYDVRPSAFR